MNVQFDSKTESLAAHLAKAWDLRKGVQPLTELNPDLTIDEAYEIQLYTINEQVKKGAKITGKKIGLTSKAMQESFGVNEPDYGHLLDTMEIHENGVIPFEKVLQPRVEAELAFVLKKDLQGPNVSSFDVLNATEAIIPALEIVDSRIKDWKITLRDTVADNASSGLYVLGNTIKRVTDIDLKQIGMNLYKNGKLLNTGVGAAALGDPAKCVAWLANKLAHYGIALKAGEVILSGALSVAMPAEPGDQFTAKFSSLGEVRVSFSES